jgi:hypothetical protein
VAVFETHVQTDHLSNLPELVASTGPTAYLPADTQVEFEHGALVDGDVLELGNTIVTAMATPGHAPAHHERATGDTHSSGERHKATLRDNCAIVPPSAQPPDRPILISSQHRGPNFPPGNK